MGNMAVSADSGTGAGGGDGGALNDEGLVGSLFKALVDDGFTSCRCGPAGDPTALIVYYQWPDCIDMVTVTQRGPAAAARLEIPGGACVLGDNPDDDSLVLNPPSRARWAYVGPPETTIFALLDLPHPECPDALAGNFPTPSELRVPREQQRPMTIRVPVEGKRGARAARLSQPGPQKIMGERFFNDLLDEVDSENAIGFASHFTLDAEFTWGNFEKRVGRTEIIMFTHGFFPMVTGVRHRLDNYYLVDAQIAITDGQVTFFRLDGTEVTVPFSTRAHFTPDGTLMTSYQVYLDPSPLVGVTIPG